MTGERRTAFRAAIDAELAALGAETETDRQARLTRDAERYERFRAQLVGDFTIY